jgi:broad specificity phosphatase PhoE
LTQHIVLVRHALSAAEPDVDSRRWGLAGGARQDCVRLADAIGSRAAFVHTSDERKAVDTASAIAERWASAVRTDERFGEVRRPYTDGDYRQIAADYLRNGNDEWEPRDAVIDRFTAAIDQAGVHDDELVVVNHGLAMSLYVASLVDIEAVAFWTALAFPDAWSLDVSTGSLRHVFTEGRPAPDQT